MLAIERRREIVAKLALDGKVIVSELAKDFDVTEETIRRDLEKLDKEGLASKTYGGAIATHNSTLDLPYNVRESVNVLQKQIISEQCYNIDHLKKSMRTSSIVAGTSIVITVLCLLLK